jgi:hypothetical protein
MLLRLILSPGSLLCGAPMKRILAGTLFLLALCGCSEVSTRTAPKADLSRFNRIYVEHRLNDGRGIDQTIVRELRHLGYNASSGSPTLMPRNTELVVRYQDEWTFDFTTYMISIDLSVHDALSDKLLATGGNYHPSITGSSAEKMVAQVLRKLFIAKPPLPDLPPPGNTPDLSN